MYSWNLITVNLSFNWKSNLLRLLRKKRVEKRRNTLWGHGTIISGCSYLLVSSSLWILEVNILIYRWLQSYARKLCKVNSDRVNKTLVPSETSNLTWCKLNCNLSWSQLSQTSNLSWISSFILSRVKFDVQPGPNVTFQLVETLDCLYRSIQTTMTKQLC